MYVCMYVCMYVSMYVCMYVYAKELNCHVHQLLNAPSLPDTV